MSTKAKHTPAFDQQFYFLGYTQMSIKEMDKNVHSTRLTPSRKISSLRHIHTIENRQKWKRRNFSSVQCGYHKRDLDKKKPNTQYVPRRLKQTTVIGAARDHKRENFQRGWRGRKRACGGHLMFGVLIWVLVILVCSLCVNPLNGTLMISLYLYFNKTFT